MTAGPAAAPPYKRIPGVWGDGQHVVVVDAFDHPLPHYVHVLSHFHSDHYRGLDASWTHGVIHVRADTARREDALEPSSNVGSSAEASPCLRG